MPPRRDPVRLRYWLMVLTLLATIWILASPSSRKVDARIDHAIVLSSACRFDEAQAELVALRGRGATAQQLARLQAAIDEAVPACERQRKAREPGGKSGARRAATHQAQSARNLIAEGERELALGNFNAAIGKMEACVAMVDAGSRECLALKARAERLQAECRAAGRCP